MKKPLPPPPFSELFKRRYESIPEIVKADISAVHDGKYIHWDVLRHFTPPARLSHEEWWLGIKLSRRNLLKPFGLVDTKGYLFRYGLADPVLRGIHQIDRDASGRIEIGEQILNPATRDRYLFKSLVLESITSSQLEGASTTRHVAKEMIRSGRKPRDRSEQMILNNFKAMQFVREHTRQQLTAELVLSIHRIVTQDTLDEPDAEGRLRNSAENDVKVYDEEAQLLHDPPPASELPSRLEKMCAFANDTSSSEKFIHPVVRAILLHFWLAYDHPFVDGNGRTARALFYWSMLSQGYWLFEFLSISQILRSAPAKYARSYLYTESDDGDATYFILYQLEVIQRAIQELHAFVKRKSNEMRQTQDLLRRSVDLNYRQLALLTHALKHPDAEYTIQSHRVSHNVVYQTARTDLLDLARRRLLEIAHVKKTLLFRPIPGLEKRIQELKS